MDYVAGGRPFTWTPPAGRPTRARIATHDGPPARIIIHPNDGTPLAAITVDHITRATHTPRALRPDTLEIHTREGVHTLTERSGKWLALLHSWITTASSERS